MVNIYVVKGSTGEYSDRTEWLVKAFRTEQEAKDHIIAVEVYMKMHGINLDGNVSNNDATGVSMSRWDMVQSVEGNPVDPNFQLDYTGTRYYVEQVELKE